ncbi:MAG TPA: hypothetical protein VHS59_05695, partial [Bacillota bacterium]|nr:hypothetical protein [Bacillota bacterium]
QRPQEPGLYTGRLEGRVKGRNGLALDLLTTLINPYVLEQSNGYSQSFTNVIEAGQNRRYFVQVPQDAKNLKLTLAIPQQDGKYQGRARIHLFNPNGEEVDQDLYDFAGVGPGTWKSTTEKQVALPMSGTWEIVIYSSATLSEYQLKSSQITLQVTAEGVTEPVQTGDPSIFTVSLNTGTYPEAEPEMVTFHVRSRETLQPYEGVMSVNSRLFSVRGGNLTIVIPKGTWPDHWEVSLPE